jgi:[acyl-carrier-protein] S-malonyltransferase
MGEPWFGTPSWSVVEELSEAAGRDVGGLLRHAGAEALRATSNAQVATFALCLVILDAAARAGFDLSPRDVGAVAGHSLGEYTALVATGALDRRSAMTLVAERAAAMQEAADACPGTMAAVIGLELPQVGDACEGVPNAWVANDNATGQVVVAGTPDGVTEAGSRATALGARRVIPLPVGGAFHTPLMAQAQPRLDRALMDAPIAAPEIPLVANVDASAHKLPDELRSSLSAQLCNLVRWRESLLALADAGADTFVELGPGSELSGMVKRTVPGAARVNVSAPGDLSYLAASSL